MSGVPIGDYGFLSDCRSAALVARDGSIDWWAPQRFDRHTIFARILDRDAGHWRIGPVAAAVVTRRYVGRTLVLETTFALDSGELVLTDLLASGPNPGGHDLGKTAPNAIVRNVRCTRGHADVVIEYAPRAEYGLVVPMLLAQDTNVIAYAGSDVMFLSSPVALEINDATVRGSWTLEAGEERTFALRHRFVADTDSSFWTPAQARRELDETLAGWESWSELHQSYTGYAAAEIRSSGRVLQGLTYAATGAIVAAPTTSLPERFGGERNWDYRYVWVRDASFTLDALWIAACRDEAQNFFSWLAHVAAGRVRAGVQIVFGVGGEHDLFERELPHLRGYRDSRPVRIGNNAWDQRQLDVYGELLNTARRYARAEIDQFDEVTRVFLVELAEAAIAAFEEKDHGIWETRGEQQHYTYSKLMCWLALDAAIELAPKLAAVERVVQWQTAKARFAADIHRRAWNEKLGAYTAAYDSDEFDASVLLMATTAFLPPADERLARTIDTIERELSDSRGLVRRYRADDGVVGDEGAFLACTFWLAAARAIQGDLAAATRAFERAASYANDLGLFSEEVETNTGMLLGNFPQALSHVGLIIAAYEIDRARGVDAKTP